MAQGSSADPFRGRRAAASQARPPPHRPRPPRSVTAAARAREAEPRPPHVTPRRCPPAPATLAAAALQPPAPGLAPGPGPRSGSGSGGGSRAGQGRGAARCSRGRLAFPTMAGGVAEPGGRGRAGLCRASHVPGTPPPGRALPAGTNGSRDGSGECGPQRGCGPWGALRGGQSAGSTSAAVPDSPLRGC